ncbi:MAG: hypothetical protein RMK19_02900 [Bacteroidia bacterium]|nr:hypothetical protein [Bacteroidia bacterium]MDW8014940.1 hypothetical protein [Bacteroidia bacterium]
MRHFFFTGYLLALAWGQNAQCIFIKLKRSPELTSDNALHSSWEEKSIRLKLSQSWEDIFFAVDDEQSDQSIAECFIPQFKVISERYTYIISIACQNLLAFQNEAPYKPSSVRVQSPISFTEDMRYFVEEMAKRHFKIPPRRLYAEYAQTYVPPIQDAIKYEELEILLNQAQLIDEEEETDDEIEVEESPESPIDDADEEELDIAD